MMQKKRDKESIASFQHDHFVLKLTSNIIKSEIDSFS